MRASDRLSEGNAQTGPTRNVTGGRPTGNGAGTAFQWELDSGTRSLANASLDADLEQFIATVAHDLESSLLVLSEHVQLMRMAAPGLNPEQADHLACIERTMQRMTRLVSGIRNYARANGEIELERVSLKKVVEESVEILAPAIEERSVEIVIEGRLPTVAGDHDQLVQLFQNLLSNAVKFGPKQGRIVVTASRRVAAWRLAISDHGPGIAPQNYGRVFEPFRRLRETGHLPGTGLGLAICRRVAQNHGGSLTIEPSDSGGATFVLTLPARALPRLAAVSSGR
jgi:signal transduction histidine kinase